METMPVRKVNNKKLISKLLVSLLALILLIFSISFVYQLFMINQFEKHQLPVGKMVDVGGYKLHLYTMGEDKGLPTVLLESGSGTPSSYADWRYIQPELAKFTRVISYDRAGYGWSEEANNTRSSQQIVNDLHTLLSKSGESGPYILVGHSFGGLNVQLFAHQYPEQVVGVVLLDSSIVGVSPDVSPSELNMTKFLRQSGLMRVMGGLGALPVPKAVISDSVSEHFLYKRFYNGDQISEIKQMGSGDFPQISLGNIPVTILSARVEEKEYSNWQEQQDDYLRLSTNSKRFIVENSSHFIHHDQPELVIKAIKEMLQ